jgi:SGNH domain (fused to AT3 domains)
VILDARWPLWQSDRLSPGEPGPARPLARLDGAADRDVAGLYQHAITETVAALRRMRRRVLVVGGVLEIGWDVPARLSAAQRFGAPPPVPTPAEIVSRQGAADALWRRAGVEYLPMVPRLCTPVCQVAGTDGVPLYVDDDHLSAVGARALFAPAIEPVLRTLR